MRVYQNRYGQRFIYIEPNGNDKAIFVTPEGKVKSIELGLLFCPEDRDEGYFFSQGLINVPQIEKYREEISWRTDFEEREKSAKRWHKFEAMTDKQKVDFITKNLPPSALKKLCDLIGLEVDLNERNS